MMSNKICLVDDDRIFRSTTKKALEKENLADEILTFSDGEEAFEYFEKNADNEVNLPDTVFLDLNMPYMDGWDFLEEYFHLKPKISKEITIYIVTSSVSEIDYSKAKATSLISGYITKPVPIRKFKELILAQNR